MDLDSMKYAELRSLAKELGLKANMKAEKLLKAIKQHYQQENQKEEEDRQEQEKDTTEVREKRKESPTHAQEQEGVSSPPVFVNTRRGRGNGTKRKISDTAVVTECDANISQSAAKDNAELPVSSEPCVAGRPKKRKVSSTKDSENNPDATGGVLQPGNQDQAPVNGDTEKTKKMAKAGKIPRYQGLLQNKPLLKPTTPNFKKLHEAHFNKMESIDSYVQRKTRQMDSYKSSVNELKQLSDKTKLLQVDGKSRVKVNSASLFSPIPANKKGAEHKRRQTLLSASKAPQIKLAGKEDVSFRPSVLSTRRINVRFSEATHDNEYKRSMVKTPARKSPCVPLSTPQTQPDGGKPINDKTLTFSAAKSPGTFVFTGNATTPGTQKLSKFDLKASLSRPLTYKPHAGKLKPFGDAQENSAANKSLISADSHQKNYKQHQVKTRENRRAKHTENRKQKKESILSARRGLVLM